MFAIVLRAMAGLIGFAGESAANLVDNLADRIDPPPQQGYARFNKRLINEPPPVKAYAMVDDPDGYWDRVKRERSQEGRS